MKMFAFMIIMRYLYLIKGSEGLHADSKTITLWCVVNSQFTHYSLTFSISLATDAVVSPVMF